MKSTRIVLSSTTTNCSGFSSEPAPHLEGREAADGDGAVERPFDVLRGDRRAVLELGVLLQLEGDRHVADLHVVGQFHLELVAVVVRNAVDRLHLVADQAVVAIPRHLVARHVGADAVDVDVVGAALGDDQQRLLARLRLGRRENRGRGDHAGSGHGSSGLEKVATFHGSLPNLRRSSEAASASAVPKFRVRSRNL